MASKIFFQFGHEKDPQVISFDGTTFSVFELKREIIAAKGLGDGKDFDLYLYHKDHSDEGRIDWKKMEEYTDDTEPIPRNTTVVARRLPASKPGFGRAARYVSGKAPVAAKNAYRTEASKEASATPAVAAAPLGHEPQTEEEKIAAMFAATGDQWEQQKSKMASAKRIYSNKGRPQNVPDYDPPPTYRCHRCHQKGHWIQACPTNDDPNFEARPRLKKTTGIPKSMLRVVEDTNTTFVNDGYTDEKRLPSAIMMTEDGKQVIAVPDEKAWEQFQAKTKAAAAKQEEINAGNAELRERGLECEIDKRLFLNPVKTPCCSKTYCHECIENALINSDLVCPNCGKEGVIIENLEPDTNMNKKITEYEDEKRKAREQQENERSATPPKSPQEKPDDTKSETSTPESKPKSEDTKATSRSPTPSKNVGTPPAAPSTPADANLKKRKAEDPLEGKRIPTAPAAMRNKETPKPQAPSDNMAEFAKQMNAMAGLPGVPNMANFGNFPAAFPNPMMGFPPNNMGMPMNPMMGFGNGMMNPMMMQNMGYMNGMGGFPQNNGFNNNNNNNMMPNQNQNQNWRGNQYHNRGNYNNHMGRGHMNGGYGMQGGRGGNFPNQQPNEEDNAYFRKPINPHRHQNRGKRLRPTEYTEL